MAAQCKAVGKHVLPVFRALIAKELVNTYKLTQSGIARRLGTTQAAISQCVNSKRAFKGTKQFGNILPILQAKAIEVAKRMSEKEMSPTEVVMAFCTICPSFCLGEIGEKEPDYTI